jgi:hypothetical protein
MLYLLFYIVQVVGRHFQEELVLHAMEIVQELVNYQRPVTIG